MHTVFIQSKYFATQSKNPLRNIKSSVKIWPFNQQWVTRIWFGRFKFTTGILLQRACNSLKLNQITQTHTEITKKMPIFKKRVCKCKWSPCLQLLVYCTPWASVHHLETQTSCLGCTLMGFPYTLLSPIEILILPEPATPLYNCSEEPSAISAMMTSKTFYYPQFSFTPM